jgi:cell division protein FtsA
MRELAQRILNKQVRIGRPRSFTGLPASSAGPDYATALGLLVAGATMPPEALNPDLAIQVPQNRQNSFFRRLAGGLFG